MQTKIPEKLDGSWFAVIYFREWSDKNLLKSIFENPKTAKYIEMSLGDRDFNIQMLKEELKEVWEHEPYWFKSFIKTWLLKPILPPQFDPNMLIITSRKAIIVCESIERLMSG